MTGHRTRANNHSPRTPAWHTRTVPATPTTVAVHRHNGRPIHTLLKRLPLTGRRTRSATRQLAISRSQHRNSSVAGQPGTHTSS